MSSTDMAIIGDIHGDVRRLESAMSLRELVGRHVVLVGDYVNRGPDTRAVLEFLVSAEADLQERLTLLRGNHDESLLRFLGDDTDSSFLLSGGLKTIKSYYPHPPTNVIDAFRAEFPESHGDLLRRTELYFETTGILVNHVGPNPEAPARRDLVSMVTDSHPALLVPNCRPLNKPLVVFGHYVQRSRKGIDLGDRICVDAGCGALKDGPLGILLLPERKFLYV